MEDIRDTEGFRALWSSWASLQGSVILGAQLSKLAGLFNENGLRLTQEFDESYRFWHASFQHSANQLILSSP